jgi:hypothetical protein
MYTWYKRKGRVLRRASSRGRGTCLFGPRMPPSSAAAAAADVVVVVVPDVVVAFAAQGAQRGF